MKSKSESESGIQTIRDLIGHWPNTQPDLAFLISPETGRGLTFRKSQERAHFLSTQPQQVRLERGKIAFFMDKGLFTAQLFLPAICGGFESVALKVRAGISQSFYTLDHCDAKGRGCAKNSRLTFRCRTSLNFPPSWVKQRSPGSGSVQTVAAMWNQRRLGKKQCCNN